MSTLQPGDDKYIRTYAKDLALAEGAPPPKPPTQEEGAVAPTPDSRQAVLDRLKARSEGPQFSRSAMLPDSLPTPVKEPEVKDSPVEMSAKPQVPSQTAWGAGDLPTFQPQAPIPRAGNLEQAAPPPVEAKEVPKSEPKPEIPPPALSYREEIPSRVEIPTIAPVVRETPKVSETLPPPPVISPSEASPIHTYSSDFSDRIDSKNASTFSVLAAQSDSGLRTTEKKKESRKNILYVAGGMMLVVAAIGVSYGAYRYMIEKNIVPLVATTPSLIFADERVSLEGEGGELRRNLVSGIDSPLQEGSVRVFFLAVASSTPLGPVKKELPGGFLIGSLQLDPPDILLRNIGEESTVGTVRAGGEQRLFLVLKVLSYERTFAGMLAWEPRILTSLADFYPEYAPPAPPPPTIATTTKIVKGKTVISTTTVEAAVPVYSPPHFVDEVTSNQNVRALKDSTGKTILLYGYKDKQILIIARDENAFGKILERLTVSKTQ